MWIDFALSSYKLGFLLRHFRRILSSSCDLSTRRSSGPVSSPEIMARKELPQAPFPAK